MSGNRNFEGRIHPHVRANYLASPPLVVVYGLAGRVDIDLDKEPIGHGTNGPVYFKDVWPTGEEVARFENEFVKPQFFREVYAKIELGSEQWQALVCSEDSLYNWDPESTYIKNPPFFDSMVQLKSCSLTYFTLNGYNYRQNRCLNKLRLKTPTFC